MNAADGDVTGDAEHHGPPARAPRAHMVAGTWPQEDARLTASAPASAHYALAVAARLHELLAARQLSHRALAALSGVHHRTIGRILRGEAYPDLATLAALEVALRTDLYPAGLYRLHIGQ